MIFNMAVSAAALARYTQRNTQGSAAEQNVSQAAQAVNSFLDSHFPDERMERIYPNAKIVN